MTKDKLEKSLVVSWPSEDYLHEIKFSLNRIGLYIHNLSQNNKRFETPNELFKFYSASENNLDSIQNSYLYFSSPRYFNDPWDCLTNREKHIMQGSEGIRQHRDNLGVCCFTTIRDNPLMWGHYTNQYRGFCVKFRNDKLLESKEVPIRTYVHYLKEYSASNEGFDEISQKIKESNEIDDFTKELFLKGITFIENYTWKSFDWNYEKEFRAISWETNKFNRKLSFESKNIEEFYIGYRLKTLDPLLYKKLRKTINENYPKSKVYEISPHPIVVKLRFIEVLE